MAAQRKALANSRVLRIEDLFATSKLLPASAAHPACSLMGLPAPATTAAQGAQQEQREHQALKARGGLVLPANASGGLLVPRGVRKEEIGPGSCTVLGQVDRQFILLRTSSSSLVCVDQHAAHERVRLEVLTQQLLDALAARMRATQGAACTVMQDPACMGSEGSASAGATAVGSGGNGGGAGGTGASIPRQQLHGLRAARRGNGGGPEPAALAQGPATCCGAGTEAQAEGGGLGPVLDLSSQELQASIKHGGLLRAWGWELRPAASAAASGGRDLGHGTVAQCKAQAVGLVGAAASGAGAAGMADGGSTEDQDEGEGQGALPSRRWVLTQVPYVFGQPLTAADLCSHLHQLQATGAAVLVPEAPRPSPGAPSAGGPASRAVGAGGSGGTAGVARSTTGSAGGIAGAGGQETGAEEAGGAGTGEAMVASGASVASGAGVANGGGNAGAAMGMGSLPAGALHVLRSRACRTAVMFGDPLLHAECEELIG